MSETIVFRCPLYVDRLDRGGWSGDRATRFVRCEWRAAIVETDNYQRGTFETFPNGPHAPLNEHVVAGLAAHIREHHSAQDLRAEWERRQTLPDKVPDGSPGKPQ